MPASRRDEELAAAAGRLQPVMQGAGIVQQYLVASGKQQRRRQAGQVAPHR